MRTGLQTSKVGPKVKLTVGLALALVLRTGQALAAPGVSDGSPLATPDTQLAATAKTQPTPSSKDALPLFGAMFAAGVPDGATASLICRPWSFVRAEVGGGYNLISKSVRGGVSLIPFGAGPSATLEGGRYFEGDANGIARTLAGNGFGDNAVLQRVGYDFANAHLGLDFGMRRVTFFIHGGMSYIKASVHNINQQISADASTSQTTVTFNQDPQIRIWTPSAKFGFVFYIW